MILQNILEYVYLVNVIFVFNPFYATGLFLYPLKTSENLWFSDVFLVGRKYF